MYPPDMLLTKTQQVDRKTSKKAHTLNLHVVRPANQIQTSMEGNHPQTNNILNIYLSSSILLMFNYTRECENQKGKKVLHLFESVKVNPPERKDSSLFIHKTRHTRH